MLFDEKDFLLYTEKLDFAALQSGGLLQSDVFFTDGALVAKVGTRLDDSLLKKLEKVKYKLVTIDVKRLYQQTLNTFKVVMEKLSDGNVPEKEVISGVIGPFLGETESRRNAADFLDYLQGRGEYLIQHSIQVGVLAMFLARWHGFDEDDVLEVALAGTMHDIGKHGVPKEILDKPGVLDEQEMNEAKKHSRYGYDLLKESEDFSDAIKEAVLAHHEREDGSGYPRGLKSEEIHPYAKVLAIVDVFQAMISDKVYKAKVSPFEALEYLYKSISSFDVEMVLTFVNNMLDYYTGGRVELNTGDAATVLYVNKDHIKYPLLKRDDGEIIDLNAKRDIWIVGMLNR